MVLSTPRAGVFFRFLAASALLFLSCSATVLGQTFPATIRQSLSPGGAPTSLPITSSGCAPLVGFSLRIRFDTGEDFIKTPGWIDSRVTVSASIVGGATVFNSIPLTISSGKPEALYVANVQVPVGSGSTTISATASTITTSGTSINTRVFVECVPEYGNSSNFTTTSYLDASAPPVPINGAGIPGFEYTFDWSLTSQCTILPGYQLQIYYSPSSITSVSSILPATWNEKALLIDTGSPETFYTLTLAEGKGFYYWRVRAIGNLAGGATNPNNLGAWEVGEPLEVTAAMVPNANLNWNYSRTFSEGGRVAEKVTFANGLQQVRQTQTRLAGSGLGSPSSPLAGQQVVATQTVQDYAGRDAVQSLPIPIISLNAGPSVLGYKSNLLKRNGTATSYEAADFDSNDPQGASTVSTFSHPVPATEQGYYSNTAAGSGTSSNERVADADGYPFTRTRFGPDGRVRDQSGVGPAMSLQPEDGSVTAHTSRTYYAAVAPQELIRLFGNEAPEAAGTYKVLSIDPNNTTSVSYQTKQGQTIATALSKAGAGTSTDPLPSATAAAYNIIEDLAGPATVVGKTLVITEPNSTVTVNYSLTPAVLQNSCLNYCASCDYKVRITIVKVNDPAFSRPPQVVDVPAQGTCSPTTSVLATAWEIKNLPIGEYRIEREIKPSPPVATGTSAPPVPALDTRLAEIQTKITTLLGSTTWNNASKTGINDLLAASNVDELYRHLLNDLHYQVVTINGSAYIQIPASLAGSTNCTSFINLPYLPEFCHPKCDLGDASTFTQLLDEKLAYINQVHETNFGVQDVLGQYTPDDFVKMLRNMQEYAEAHHEMNLKYSCQELMACVHSQLAMLEVNLTVTGNSPTGYNYNFVDEFLTCTGLAMTEPVDIQSQNLDPARAFAQFTFDSNDVHDRQCMIAAYVCQHKIRDPARILAIDFINDVKPELGGFADYTLECRTQAYNCLKNHTPVPAGQAGANGLNARDEAEKAAREIERSCRSTCSDRRAEFRASVIDGFHRRGLNVVGDAFYVSVNAHGEVSFVEPIKPGDPALVEACQVELLTQALVEQCQQDCKVTVDEPLGNGVFYAGTEAELARMQKVMFNSYEVEITSPGENCPRDLGPVKTGNQFSRAELTSCAQDVLNYVGALVRGVPQLMANSSRPRSCNVPVGTVGSNGTNKVFSVIGPLLKDCTQTGACRTQEEAAFPDVRRVNHWVTVIDSREPVQSMAPNQAYDPEYDFSIVWSRNSPVCPITGEDVPGLPKGLSSSCGETSSPYGEGAGYYQLYFTDENGAAIAKKDISDVSAVFLDEPFAGSSALAPGLSASDLFTAEGIKVRLTLTSGTWMVARVVASFYDERNDPRSSPQPTPRLDNYLQWKTIESCSPTQSTVYGVCFKWSDDSPATTVEPGTPIFTGEPAPCNEVLARQLQQQLSASIGQWRQDQLADVTQQYQTKCMALAGAQEHFTVSYSLGYHHFTLYYYDRGGNLLRTVPPKGVNPLADTDFMSSTTVPTLKPRGQWGMPAHTLVTRYTYNSLHQLVSQSTPDGGTTNFYYNRKGQLRFSRNSRQQKQSVYSYTKYDALGRAVEVGESSQDIDTNTRGGGISPVLLRIEDVAFPMKDKHQVTTTVYSTPATAITYSTGTLTNSPYASASQRYLTNRVSYATLDVDGNPATTADNSNTYYSYDPHGNVEWLIQQQDGLGSKYLRYEYDLISNKVLRVNYQEGQDDQFYHRYNYDGDNRLTQVYTSSDGVIWDQDARYSYYPHGPLKRLELGEDHVQGLDYTYTLQGWLKAINHPTTDPGNDGAGTAVTSTAKDEFAMSLGYYPGDYATTPGTWTTTGQLSPTQTQGLYNGNIATWTNWLDNVVNGYTPPVAAAVNGETYRYDELNRLLSTRTSLFANGAFTASDDYKTDYTYDANGNLLTLNRNSGAQAITNGNALDVLQYHYDKSGTNQLTRVDDFVTAGQTAGYDDVKPFTGPGTTQFDYDEIGNLIYDASDGGIATIDWTVYGKIASVTRNNGSVTSFRYDPAGNRILKTLSTNNGTQVQRTYYVRDAQGNILATYNQQVNQSAVGAITLREHSLYGSSRLGVRTPGGGAALGPGYYARAVGEKKYELADHLGNVRAVVSDAKMPGTGGAYKASLAAYYNYYAFGMLKPDDAAAGTPTGAGGYRYGYNGKERDDNGEIGLTTYDYGFRIYNPGLGKFLSTDPLTKSYPMLTPYQFASNRPIDGMDLDGLEVVLVNRAGKNALIWKAAEANTDKSAIHVYGHGDLLGLVRVRDNGQYTLVKTAGEFKSILKSSNDYETLSKSEDLWVVLHSCRTGRPTINGETTIPAYAQAQSLAQKITIVAPDERDYFNSDGEEMGPYQTKFTDPINRQYKPGVPESKHGQRTTERGNWLVYKQGVLTNVFDGEWTPVGNPGTLDKLMYEKSITYTVNSPTSMLNVRQGPGTSFGKIGSALPQGSQLIPTGNVNSGWMEIKTEDGRAGWVKSDYTKAKY